MKEKLLNRGRQRFWPWCAGAAFLGHLGLAAAQTATNRPPAAGASGGTNLTQEWMSLGLDRIGWLHQQVLGNPLWQYLAALIYLIASFYVSKLLDAALQVQLHKWAARTKAKFNDLVVNLVRGPVKLVCFVVLLHVGLQAFAWPQWQAKLISDALKVIAACALTYVATKFVDLLLGVWQQRVESAQDGMLDMHLFPIIRKTLKIFVLVVAVLVTSSNLGMDITGLLASLSVGGLAVGLAAQDTLSNLFGAVAIFADKPFRVGDHIQLDPIEGTVEAIGLRSTRVRNLDGHLVTIPNRTVANASIVNVSKRPRIKTVMNIGVTYDTPSARIERAMQLIQEIYRPHPKTADLLVSFNKFDSSACNILVVHWWNSSDFREYLDGFQKLNLELKRRFDEEGISFAFPSQTVYLRQDSQWKVADGEQG